MHLRSITLKGFKSFPHRTRLEFAPGVSVVVGPNGSGKSNVTEAVLWALGEQSPLAVRGQTMKDVIFAGGHGLASSSSAEVEVVIDNSEGSLPADFSEISIVRRLDRDGEGEYRLNGARCRLVDVIELLSDSGLGKEMHSVVSQGKVETIVHSRPRDRRLMIEEAAGLGKHRKRRRRAQLKLERTEENLARALDVEREARSRLRPLKRQAEAAELHQRLERQSLEARLELARERSREVRLQLGEAESRAGAAQEERSAAERLLAGVASAREEAEEAFAAHSRTREELQSRLYAARSAADRIGLRLERAGDQARAAAEGGERRRRALAAAEEALADDDGAGGVAERIAALEQELAGLEEGRAERLRDALAGLEQGLGGERAERERLSALAAERRLALERAEASAEAARGARREAEAAVESARAAAARVGSDLAAVNQFLRAAGPRSEGPTLADGLRVRPGLEAALAAALGPRLSAAVVDDVPAGQALLDRAGDRGGLALLAGGGPEAPHAGTPPVAGATPLLTCVDPTPELSALAQRLLDGVWLVDSLDDLPRAFPGLAVTASGRSLDGRSGELAQAPAGGAERVLEERNRRDELVAGSERAAAVEAEARRAAAEATDAVRAADAAREEADVALRRALRDEQGAAEAAERTEWLIARRRQAPEEGPEAVRAAELTAEVRAERRLAEEAYRRRRRLASDAERLRAGVERHETLARDAARAARSLAVAREAVAERRDSVEAELRAGAAAGEETAAALRALAHEEADLQARLKRASEALVAAEVAAQQVRDAAADAEDELNELAGRLGLEPAPTEEPLSEDRTEELRVRVERLAHRREQLGPVNPLAAQEYEEAVAHVEELEGQRSDLENALAELQSLIKETDRRIRVSFEETFEATARNFEEVVQHLFPGGRGRLRLVHPEGPRPVLGGEEAREPAEASADRAEPSDGEPAAAEPGVEVEVTPAGKAMKRLSLLSGGEKSLVALAFMFAVFLARPCPFYILDEVEAALDDLNIDRFLELIRRYSDRAQFIVVTHQKRTMDAADCLYGVSMGGDGVSRVVSRRLGQDEPAEAVADEGQTAAA
ncbi:MAG TPA: AAA family ATPase [Thermoleophilaceae bacterium]|nr:AAA family ATPase [Thermoleophilaceae bacterium]